MNYNCLFKFHFKSILFCLSSTSADMLDERLRILESVCNICNDTWSHKPIIATILTDIAEIKSQLAALDLNKCKIQAYEDEFLKVPSLLADIDILKSKLADFDKTLKINATEIETINSQLKKLQPEDEKSEKENIFEPEIVTDSCTKFETNIDFLKSHLKRLHDDMNLKIYKKLKKKHEALNKHIQTITQDVHNSDISSTRDQISFFTDYIAASSNTNKSQLLKLQLKVLEQNKKTDRVVQHLKSSIEIASENNMSVNKYSRLENMIVKLTEKSTSCDYIDESVKQQLTITTSKLIKLSTKMQFLESKNNEIQCFVDEIAKLSDPDLKKNYELQVIIVETMQNEITLQRKKLREKISQLNKTFNEKIMQVASKIVDK